MDHLDRIESKIDKVTDRLAEQQVHLAKIDVRLGIYNNSLHTHMKRSDSLEKQVAYLYKIKYYVAGGVAVITALSAVLFQYIKIFVEKL